MDPSVLKSLRQMGCGFGVASVPRAQLKALMAHVSALEARVYELESKEIWLRDQLRRMRDLTWTTF